MVASHLKPIIFGGASLSRFFAGAGGFWLDFTKGATGAAIASIASQPPGTASASQGTASSQPSWNLGGWGNFDGGDDTLLSNLNPTTSITLGVCGRITSGAAIQSLIGSQLASSGRIRLSLNASNVLCASVGANLEASISSGVTVGGVDFVALLVVNSLTTELWVNGLLKTAPALNGAPNTTTPLSIAANNVAGTPSGFAGGRIYRACAIQREADGGSKVPIQRALAAGILSGF